MPSPRPPRKGKAPPGRWLPCRPPTIRTISVLHAAGCAGDPMEVLWTTSCAAGFKTSTPIRWHRPCVGGRTPDVTRDGPDAAGAHAGAGFIHRALLPPFVLGQPALCVAGAGAVRRLHRLPGRGGLFSHLGSLGRPPRRTRLP